ncbi:hypothetical protein [Massilia sp. TWP1-3-3]|uniref:hypothetical protein n=1 Tax=Massilia sp. TWP1-3-3 TaxID=2804573 RepID=UPI003CEA4D9C
MKGNDAALRRRRSWFDCRWVSPELRRQTCASHERRDSGTRRKNEESNGACERRRLSDGGLRPNPFFCPLHKVTLSDFVISKNKVTLAEYDSYVKATGLPLPYTGSNAKAGDVAMRAHPESARFPVGVDGRMRKIFAGG